MDKPQMKRRLIIEEGDSMERTITLWANYIEFGLDISEFGNLKNIGGHRYKLFVDPRYDYGEVWSYLQFIGKG